MKLVTRNPKTGRFESASSNGATTKKVIETTSNVSEKVHGQEGELKATLLINPLVVFSKKSMDGKPSNIKAGTEVILTPIGDKIRVKKLNSSRTFYTTENEVKAAV